MEGRVLEYEGGGSHGGGVDVGGSCVLDVLRLCKLGWHIYPSDHQDENDEENRNGYFQAVAEQVALIEDPVFGKQG